MGKSEKAIDNFALNCCIKPIGIVPKSTDFLTRLDQSRIRVSIKPTLKISQMINSLTDSIPEISQETARLGAGYLRIQDQNSSLRVGG